MSKGLSLSAQILQDRTAFALFLKSGIEEVEKLFPSSVAFVTKHKSCTLKEVSQILTKKLEAQSKHLIPA